MRALILLICAALVQLFQEEGAFADAAPAAPNASAGAVGGEGGEGEDEDGGGWRRRRRQRRLLLGARRGLLEQASSAPAALPGAAAPAAPAYLIRSVDNLYVGISPLTADYLNCSGVVSTYRPALEGMAVFRVPNGTYYAVLSHMTGWEPNPLVLLRADGPSLADPRWRHMGNPTHEPRSYHSQPTFVVQLRDKRARPYFALMSDNWVRAGPRGLRDAGYIWLPLIFHSHSVRPCPVAASPPDLGWGLMDLWRGTFDGRIGGAAQCQMCPPPPHPLPSCRGRSQWMAIRFLIMWPHPTLMSVFYMWVTDFFDRCGFSASLTGPRTGRSRRPSGRTRACSTRWRPRSTPPR